MKKEIETKTNDVLTIDDLIERKINFMGDIVGDMPTEASFFITADKMYTYVMDYNPIKETYTVTAKSETKYLIVGKEKK